MSNVIPIDIPVISGIKRQVETNDKPPYVSNYIRDMYQPIRGVWERRPGYVKAHPDRSNHYDYITRYNQRTVTYAQKDADEGSGRFRLSPRRKSIAVGESDGQQYVFTAMTRDNYVDGDAFQQVQIYRGKLDADGVTVLWDEGYSANDIAKLGVYYDEQNFIHYSMVTSLDKTKLYLALAIVVEGGTDYIKLIEISGLYNEAWSPVWSELLFGLQSVWEAPDGFPIIPTNEVDLDIDSVGDIHLYFVLYNLNTLCWTLSGEKHDVSAGSYSTLGSWQVADGYTINGMSVKASPKVEESGNNYMYLIYNKDSLLPPNAMGVQDVRLVRYENDDSPDYDDYVTVTIVRVRDAIIGNAYLECYGCSLAIDTDGVVCVGYLPDRNSGQLKIKRGEYSTLDIFTGTAVEIEVCSNLFKNPDNLFVFYGVYNTNWDLLIKDGVIIVYYVRPVDENERKVDNAQVRLVRKVFVCDALDADYTGEAFGDEEFVEESELNPYYVHCYNRFESDAVKRCLCIYFGMFEGGEVHKLNYIRMDRGHMSFDGSVQMVYQKSVHRYNAAGVDAMNKLTILQCQCFEGVQNGFADTKYRFYYRGAYQWMLLEGQEDECRTTIIQETTISDRARFWDNNGILRAGCGIQSGNTPIWYGLIDRQIYRNEAQYALRGRRFRLAELPPPNVGDFVVRVIRNIWGDGEDRIEGDVGYEMFYDKDVVDDAEGAPWHYEKYDEGATYTIRGFIFAGARITSKFRTLNDGFLKALDDALGVDVYTGFNNDLEQKLPYTEVFIGVAYRYDNGQISQITPVPFYRQTSNGVQSENILPGAVKLGIDISDLAAAAADAQNNIWYNGKLRIEMNIDRWDVALGNPRVTSIIVFMHELTRANQVWGSDDLVWKPWKEFYVAKPYKERFKNDAINGDYEWENPEGGASLVGSNTAFMDGTLDWGAFNKNLLTETAVDYIGTGAILNKEPLYKHVLDGYIQAVVAGGRPFYLGIRLNDEKLEEAFIWGVDSMNGGALFVSPDVISPAFLNLCKFLIKGGKVFNTSNIVVIGDTDIEYGSVEGEGNAANWLIRGTDQDVGCLARDSIANLAEVGDDNGMGTLYIDNKGYARLFQLYGSRVIGNDVFKAFVRGYNPAARTTTTCGGLESLAASDAMAVYIAQYRLLMIGFPSSSLMLVRNFAAEGEEWVEWQFANVPRAWCVAPEGYLLFTDGEHVFKWDGSATTDDGTVIQPQGILADVAIPINCKGQVSRIGASYICDGTTLKLTVIRDDGERTDQWVALPAKTIKGWEYRLASWQKPVNAQFSVKWELTTPGDCIKFELHALKVEVEVERYE